MGTDASNRDQLADYLEWYLKHENSMIMNADGYFTKMLKERAEAYQAYRQWPEDQDIVGLADGDIRLRPLKSRPAIFVRTNLLFISGNPVDGWTRHALADLIDHDWTQTGNMDGKAVFNFRTGKVRASMTRLAYPALTASEMRMRPYPTVAEAKAEPEKAAKYGQRRYW